MIYLIYLIYLNWIAIATCLIMVTFYVVFTKKTHKPTPDTNTERNDCMVL